MAKTDFLSVDEYIASYPQATQATLRHVRILLRDAFPGAQEMISYQIPTFKLYGKYALYFAAHKKHYSIYPATDAILESLGEELKSYLSGKATIRFFLSRPVPEELIRRIAACRAREIAESLNSKK